MRRLFAACGVFGAALVAAVPAQAAYPIHAVVLAAHAGVVVARTHGATGMLASGIYRFTSPGGAALRSGSEIDALVEPERGGLRLLDISPGPAFVSGLPGRLRVRTLHAGDPLPALRFVDQDGRRVVLSQWRGKTLILSFVYTRCPLRNVCPAVSGKFAYLQRLIDPAHTHLAIVTLDPNFDSPSVMRRYGTEFQARADRWSLLTGEGHQVGALLDAFSLSPLQDGPGDFLHEEALVLVDPSGIVRDIVATPGWDPQDVLAETLALQGRAVNPLRRVMLAAVAGIALLCGGYSFGTIMLELGAVALTLLVCAGLFVWFFLRVVVHER